VEASKAKQSEGENRQEAKPNQMTCTVLSEKNEVEKDQTVDRGKTPRAQADERGGGKFQMLTN